MYVNVHVTVHDLEKLMDVFRSTLVKRISQRNWHPVRKQRT